MVSAFVSVVSDFGNHYSEPGYSLYPKQYLIVHGQFDVPRSMPDKPLGIRGLVPHLARQYSFCYAGYSPPFSHDLSLACKNFEFIQSACHFCPSIAVHSTITIVVLL